MTKITYAEHMKDHPMPESVKVVVKPEVKPAKKAGKK